MNLCDMKHSWCGKMFEFLPLKNFKQDKQSPGVLIGTLTGGLPFTTHTKEGEIAVYADSLQALFAAMPAHFPVPQRDRQSSSSKETSPDFYGLENYEVATNIFTKEAYKIRKFEAKEENVRIPENNGNEVQFDLTGDFIDIGRVIEGHPEHFGYTMMGNPRGLFATIVINLDAVCTIEADTLNARAERVVRLVDWLESQQIRTEILAFSAGTCGYFEIMIKQAHDSLNLDALAVVGHSDFFRRIIFRMMEYSSTWSWGYGLPITIYENRMTLPEIQSPGLLIYSEIHPNTRRVHDSFDRGEKELEKAISEGDKFYKAVL